MLQFLVMFVSLLDQLFVAVKTTAAVDREATARRATAEQSYRRKLELIRETENLDPEALANEALALRERRRMMEERVRGSVARPSEF